MSDVDAGRQVGQCEMSIRQDDDEVMNQLVVGAFFMHPDDGLSISQHWIEVGQSMILRASV